MTRTWGIAFAIFFALPSWAAGCGDRLDPDAERLIELERLSQRPPLVIGAGDSPLDAARRILPSDELRLWTEWLRPGAMDSDGAAPEFISFSIQKRFWSRRPDRFRFTRRRGEELTHVDLVTNAKGHPFTLKLTKVSHGYNAEITATEALGPARAFFARPRVILRVLAVFDLTGRLAIITYQRRPGEDPAAVKTLVMTRDRTGG